MREEWPQDVNFVAELYASTRMDELSQVGWPEQAKREFLQQQFVAQRSGYRERYPGAEWLIVERAGMPVGRCYLWLGESEIRLMEIALVRHACGQGIGTALMVALLELAGAMARDVTLHVEPDNPAQRLYARLGFQLEEQRGVYDFLRWRAIS